MSQPPEPVEHVRRLINGYQISQAIGVAATLGVPDQLAGGPRSAADLAVATGAEPASLVRLLRALVALGILRHTAEPPDTFELTELGQVLRSDAPDSLAGWASFVVRPYHWETWGDLLHAVRTGQTAFSARHGSESIWTWRQQRPEENERFNRAMHALSVATVRRLADRYDFGRFDKVADLGGGDGTLLAEVLRRHPGVQGVLFDLPHVVLEAPPRLRAAGVEDRVEVLSGSFFDGIPVGCDAYILKSILHDWDDEASVSILQRIHAVATPATTVLMVERLPGADGPGPITAMSDLNMMAMTGGSERTLGEWRALAGTADLEITRTVDLGAEWSVIEAHPRKAVGG